MAYEINVNVNGANAGTDSRASNATTGAVAGAAASTALSNNYGAALNRMGSEGGVGIGNRGSSKVDRFAGRQLGGNIMRESLTPGTGSSLALRAQGFGTGAAVFARNVSMPTGKQLYGSAVAGAAVYTAYLDYQQQAATLRGESHKADRISEQKEVIGTATLVGGALMTGNPVVIAMTLAGLSYKYALENKKLIQELKDETVRSGYYSRRLVQSISEVR